MKTILIGLLCVVTIGMQDQAFGQTGGTDTVVVRVKLPNGQFTRTDTLLEGGTFRLSGFPFPLQYLNGGELKFPDGSLKERVTITIELPNWAKIVGSTVGFGDSVAAAARFIVARRDTVVSPYTFTKPVELTLPIPPSLPPAVGAKVSALALSFRDTTGKFDTTGIRTVFRDSVLKIVKAEIGHFSDIVMTSSTLLLQSGSAADTVIVRVKLPTGQFARTDTLREGGTFRFSGLAFPLQYLNGGELKFPDGSLKERVTITIELPNWAKIVGSTVGFGDSVAAAARFIVARRDTVIKPYRFEKPVELTLPIPSSLPTKIGSQVSKYVLTFRDTTGKFDTTGVRTMIRDSVLKIVKAEVRHFSDIAMTSSDLLGGSPTGVVRIEGAIPEEFELYQNYPNPFNPSTTIRFSIPKAATVSLIVYDIRGRVIRNLVNDKEHESGYFEVRWDGRNNRNQAVSSGIYFAHLYAGTHSRTIKLVLNK